MIAFTINKSNQRVEFVDDNGDWDRRCSQSRAVHKNDLDMAIGQAYLAHKKLIG